MKKKPDNPKRANQASRNRTSRLSAALLRIGASLDLDTVLKEIVESARTLTRARYGAMATIDDSGQLQDSFISGLTPEEQQRILDWPDGPRVFEHFRELPGALRVEDLPGYMRSLGVAGDPLGAKTFQVTPMASSGESRRLLLSWRQGRPAGIHERGRRGAGVVRVAGGGGHRQRSRASGRTTGAVGPRGSGGHLTGGYPGLQRQDRPSGSGQSGSEADCRRPAHLGPLHRAVAGGNHAPAGRRAGRLPSTHSRWRRR